MSFEEFKKYLNKKVDSSKGPIFPRHPAVAFNKVCHLFSLEWEANRPILRYIFAFQIM